MTDYRTPRKRKGFISTVVQLTAAILLIFASVWLIAHGVAGL